MVVRGRSSLAGRLAGSAAFAGLFLGAAQAAEPQQQVAAAAVAAPAPKPTAMATSHVLPKPTAAQYAAFEAYGPKVANRGTEQGPGQVDFASAQLYGMQLFDPAQAPGSVVPERHFLQDVQSLWLADGRVVQNLTTGDVPSQLTANLSGPGAGGLAIHRVEGDKVTVDQVLFIDGKAIAVRGLKVPLGQTSVVELAGGHILSLTPRLRRMTDAEWASVVDDLEEDTPARRAERQRRISRFLNPEAVTASPGG